MKTNALSGKTEAFSPDAPNEAQAQGNPDLLQALIAETAYFKAEQRGFEAGWELVDWLEAEKEILKMQEKLSLPTPD